MRIHAALIGLVVGLLPVSSSASDLSGRFVHVAEGTTVRAEGPLRVVAADGLVVDGVLLGDAGHPVELFSRGPLVVRGRIVGGDGLPGGRGGDVVLRSLTEVRVEAGAEVASGSGGDAPAVRENLRAVAADGGDGGDILVDAPRTALEGTVRLGSGGRGGDATAMLARAGGGGAAGDLVHDGDVVTLVGGRGGDGGDALVRPAQTSEAETAQAACGITIGRDDALAGNPAKPGKPSGDGSAGASSNASGGDGEPGATGTRGTGGGPGAFAVAFAGDGKPGNDGCPGSTGGRGGKAQALGGDGGDSTSGVGGSGGDATAVGGAGGVGGTGGAGGGGGRGGPALVGPGGDGGPGGNGGSGGNGGIGGDACAQGGAGGTGPAGEGPTGSATATPGAAGAPGPGGAAGQGGFGGTSLLGLTDGTQGTPGEPGGPGEPGSPGVVVDAPCLAAVRVAFDPYSGGEGQHRTLVEPDSFAHGSTVVTTFQVARVFNGGAMNVGWATSTDDGVSWTSGLLPGITTIEGGPWARASDPVVAYSARDDVWLIQTLGISTTGGVAGRVVLVNRSTDGGLTWGPPVTVAGGPTANLDKNWVVCDNWESSPYYGNCYSTWDDHGAGNRMEANTSTDGGLTWGPVMRPADNAGGLGGVPVVRPDGKVVIPYTTGWSQIRAFNSTNGGASWSASTPVSNVTYKPAAGNLRAPPLPSAEIAGDGTIYVAWQDCRFRSGCTSNDIVFSTSTDGVSWTAPVRIPIDPVDSGVDHFIPGLAVDVSTSGPDTRLFVVYYMYPVAACTSCSLQVGYGGSTDAGATWSFERLHPTFPVSWISNTSQGRMFGDYISASFLANGRAVPIWSHAYPPQDGVFDQGMETIMGGVDLSSIGPAVAAGDEGPAPAGPAPPAPGAPPTVR